MIIFKIIIKKIYFIKLFLILFNNKLIYIMIMILGIGDWGLGIGDWGLGPIPNPQSPIPNPLYILINYRVINLLNPENL